MLYGLSQTWVPTLNLPLSHVTLLILLSLKSLTCAMPADLLVFCPW